jgi:hypothetical protein
MIAIASPQKAPEIAQALEENGAKRTIITDVSDRK